VQHGLTRLDGPGRRRKAEGDHCQRGQIERGDASPANTRRRRDDNGRPGQQPQPAEWAADGLDGRGPARGADDPGDGGRYGDGCEASRRPPFGPSEGIAGYLASVPHVERIVPRETSSGILALHLKRYDFALRFADDADVLDAGCGVGYGSVHLARAARTVVAVDRSAAALQHAREHFVRPNVEYIQADVVALPFEDARFDVVCAFEVIEHVGDPATFVGEVARVLRDDGVLVVSTPHVARTNRSPANPHHVVELAPDELERILADRFGSVELLGQRRRQTRRHRLMQRLDVLGLRRRLKWLEPAAALLGTPTTRQVELDDVLIEPRRIEGASEVLGVCRWPRRA
jgi:SAM-dependent methyltransferase